MAEKVMVDSWLEKSSVENSVVEEQLCATIICQFDELSLTWLDCLQIYSEDFNLFAEIDKILLSFFYSHFLNFHAIHVSSSTFLYQKTEL